MERNVLESHLKHAEEQVRLAERIVTRQGGIARELVEAGQDTGLAEGTLSICELALSARIAERDALRKQLERYKF